MYKPLFLMFYPILGEHICDAEFHLTKAICMSSVMKGG